MPLVITCAMTSCAHCAACAHRQASHPYDFGACQKLLIGSLPELCITFHLHYISLALHLKILPCQHEVHAMSRFKCHALH